MLPRTEREKSAPSPGQKVWPSDIPAAGQVIAGKYEVERVIGAGGMGVVLAAHHLQLPQRVAIKFMRAEASQDATAVERFLREARAAATLSSEHVTRVLDVGTLERGASYMVMEYLEGTDLAQVLQRRGPVPVADAVGWILEACEAIAEAHALGIVHRDLKPANLFLSKRRDGATAIKVLDFGISKLAGFNTSTSDDLTASGLVMGSPGYMSPEQVRSAKGVDARTDIWALGVILYELLSGKRPFPGETLGEILTLIVSETPPRPRTHRPDIPEGLDRVVMQCLERKLDRRIRDVGELASKLVSFGPREGQSSLERILRWRSAPSAAPSLAGETQTAPTGIIAFPETGPPWQRSGAAEVPLRRSSKWRGLAAASVGGAVIVGAGVYTLGSHSRSTVVPNTSSRAIGEPPSSTSVPPAESPTMRAPAAPQPEIGLVALPDAASSVVPHEQPAVSTSPIPRRTPKVPSAPQTPSTKSNEKDLY